MTNEVLVWLSANDSDLVHMQMTCFSRAWCILSSWCHWHSVVLWLIEIQNDFTFLVPFYPGCPGKEAIKLVFVCFVCICADKMYQPYQSDGPEPSGPKVHSMEFDYHSIHTQPHDKADVLVALATVKGTWHIDHRTVYYFEGCNVFW